MPVNSETCPKKIYVIDLVSGEVKPYMVARVEKGVASCYVDGNHWESIPLDQPHVFASRREANGYKMARSNS